MSKEAKTERFSRLITLSDYGEGGHEAVKTGRVAIIGMGGLGSNVAMELAQMGVGYLRIVDHDVVELNNLPRTPLYTIKDVEQLKVIAAQQRLQKIHPAIEIDAHATYFSEKNADTIITSDIDVVIDGMDSFPPRFVINQRCHKIKVPYIFAGALGYSANLSTFTYSKDCPCLACHFSDRLNSEEHAVDTCDTVGVHTSIVTIAASIEVLEAIQIIQKKKPHLEGKLLFIDLPDLSFNKFNISQNKECHICCLDKNETNKYLESIEKRAASEIQLCGSDSYVISLPNKINLNVSLENLATKVEKFEVKRELGKVGSQLTYKNISITMMKSGTLLFRNVKSKQDLVAILELLKQHIEYIE